MSTRRREPRNPLRFLRSATLQINDLGTDPGQSFALASGGTVQAVQLPDLLLFLKYQNTYQVKIQVLTTNVKAYVQRFMLLCPYRKKSPVTEISVKMK